MPQHKRLQPQLGRLQSPEGIFPRPTQVADRCIVEGRDLARGEVPGAQEPGPWPGVTAVGGDPVARLVGHHRGRAHPAAVVFYAESTREPIPPRAGFRDQDEVCGLGLPLPHQGVEVTWARATRSPES